MLGGKLHSRVVGSGTLTNSYTSLSQQPEGYYQCMIFVADDGTLSLDDLGRSKYRQ